MSALGSAALAASLAACAALALAGCRSAGSVRGEGVAMTSHGPTAVSPGASGATSGPRIDSSVEAAVLALASDDFETRSRAAEDLVVLGERALPALAAAGDVRVAAHGRVAVSVTRPVIEAILAAAPDAGLARAHLSSDGAAVRRAAAEDLGRRRDWGCVPALIDRLEDADAGVRSASAVALRRITNRFLGSEGGAAPCDATCVAGRWREWWNREGRLAASAPAPTPR